MNERIKEIRKSKGLTQSEFGAQIGVKGTTITNYESGGRTPSDAIIVSICREFDVNEHWLRTGEGDMFVHTVPNTIDQLARKFSLDDLDKKILGVYAQLPAQHRAALKEYFVLLARELVPSLPDSEQLSLDLPAPSVAEVEKQYAATEMTDEEYIKNTSDGVSKTG